ncbi:ABC transporter ATP-binding protein [Anaeromyxobacter paludicola]|uniref:Choline transporter n=1 Tax=Anaeromyxobacter paludicola TaxID=2918171 RepID=A0ABM7XFN9_9BACT|nr:phosphate ABC transporter ATP-binding protein [Anaeromyxobacter paludicola]BDG10723.1 choline transporter [Anaeromyxobacter paludicola]
MSPNAPSVLRTEHLSRAVDGRALVDGVSVEVREGEVLAVVGPSGAGKSTFLRLLNRLDEPTGGTVYLDGQDYRSLPPRELRRRVGMVMQTASLFPGTVADNVRFGPRQRGVELPEAEVEALLRQVGLPGFAGRDASRLSGGEAQRVAIARAVANEPAVLLLDEPTSALDEASKREIERLVAGVVEARGLTCVVITHDLAQAARVAGRVLVLEAGRVRRLGPVEEVLRAESTGP